MSKESREMRAVQQWNKMKSIGENKFIWVNGVMKYGLPMGIIFPVIWLLMDVIFSSYSYSNKKFIISIIVSIPVFSINGYIMAVLLWRKYEKKYNG